MEKENEIIASQRLVCNRMKSFALPQNSSILTLITIQKMNCIKAAEE